MRKKAYGTVKVRAISGTYVVFLAFDMKPADATGLMGFAIQRGATCTVAAVDEFVTRRKLNRLISMIEASLWV